MKARYFCGNCSREVSANAAMCPQCGSSFTGIRCPKCGFKGKAAAFRDGCPSCGYMMKQDIRVLATPAPAKRLTRGMSQRFYRVAGIVLLTLFAILIVLLLIRS